MSKEIQLELNILNKTKEELKFDEFQNQIDSMNESMGKVRRKLFAEMTELKKLYQILQLENQELKKNLRNMKNEKTEWIYAQDGHLFNMPEYKKFAS